MKTTIAEGSGDEASIELLLENAKIFDVAAKRAAELVSDMAGTISAGWKIAAKCAGMKPREVAAYEAAFVHDEARIAIKLGSASPKAESPTGPTRPDTGQRRR